MWGPAGGENTKTGNASAGAYQRLHQAALLTTWVVLRADWLIKVAAVSGGQEVRGHQERPHLNEEDGGLMFARSVLCC